MSVLLQSLSSMSNPSRRIRLIGLIVLFILLVQSIAIGKGYSSQTLRAMPLYNVCGNGQGGHCYGRQRWYGAWGSKTAITIVPLSCNYSGGQCYFIDNEMWLVQQNNSQCSADASQCWVEVGYYNDPGDGHTESYFWADERPGSPFYQHFIANIPAGDYNVPALFEISQTCGTSCWNVSIYATREYYEAESTNNSMNPTGQNSYIQIGMELAGSNSNAASSNPAYFTQNAWYNASNASWYFQTNSGIPGELISYAPPWIRQVTAPANGNSGGLYLTSCCTSEKTRTSPVINEPSVHSNVQANTSGIPALTPQVRQRNGAMFDTTLVSSYVLTHPMPRTLRQEVPTKTAIQKIVYAKSQDISKLLDGENLGVPNDTVLCYVQMSGTFVFPSLPGVPDMVYHQGVEVFDATTGNLLLAGG